MRIGVARVPHRVSDPEYRYAVSDELPQDMRSTVLLYPALLRRLKKITINATAKGCSLGVREIDPHLEAEVAEAGGFVGFQRTPVNRGDIRADSDA